MASFDMRLLGGFEARLDTGEKITLSTRKAAALLACLALAPGMARSREQLAGLLWSDRAEAQAKSSLRQALTSLRRGLQANGATVLKTEGESVSLEPSAVCVDVLEFEQLAANGSNGNLARADMLYQGTLLDGLDIRDPAFNEWLIQERTRLHELAISAVDRLAAGLLREGDHEAAIAAAQRLLALDPLRESAYRTLMRLYAEQDQRGLAARQFERCREMLARELGIEPAPATRRLYEEIVGSGKGTETHEAARLRLTDPLPLPSKPSVAVLPFTNLSGDPDQSYLSDGLTADVIADLSRFQSLFVIGPESSLAMKERTISLAQVAGNLGIEYVVEGSVRRAGETLRVTVQLIDPSTGHRLWAERYDGPFADVFEIQDEIVGNIAGALSVNIEHARTERTRHRPSRTLDAYDCCLRARRGVLSYTSKGFAEAKILYRQAIDLDAGYAPAWAGLARIFNKDAFFKPGIDPNQSIVKARTHAEKAISLDRKLAMAYAALSWAHMNLRDYDLAHELLDQATALTPNDCELLALRAFELAYLGEFDAAIESAEHGLRMNPYSPDPYLDAKATVYFLTGRYQDSLRFFAQVGDLIPDCMSWEVAAHAFLGNEELARRKAEEFLNAYAAIWSGDSSAGPEDYLRWITEVSNPFARGEDRQRLVEGLRRAGLPA